MVTKRTFDREGDAHFVTFSCYRRRRLLDHDRAKKIVMGVLNSQLSQQAGRCVGFVIMPDHVHAGGRDNFVPVAKRQEVVG